MQFNFLFVLNSILFGVGLAMDAFSVSIANGLNEPKMPVRRMLLIAGTFAVFQTAMPLTGWLCVHSIAEAFQAFQPFIPWIALALLLFIGIKMIVEGRKEEKDGDDEEVKLLRGGALLVQGIATSIDALSVGFTIAEYTWVFALIESVIIGLVTFGICIAGIKLGKTVGMKLAGKASIFGGIILILIGLEIFITGIC
ncbi:MAG: manganese efflux pump [Clostridia bacterium]|nr:manganese efflux pump [Clostridia bacterium]